MSSPSEMSRSVTARASAADSPATNLFTTLLVYGAVSTSRRTPPLREAAKRTWRSNLPPLARDYAVPIVPKVKPPFSEGTRSGG
ncbi:hypothetical protein Airi02_064580 [Actinoallomurus iriomotensis]|uniref:Uncharacterized protein n=1 Tax=Actinoallomurus iriomotensis TaxID=478107 RepID=A0A9W6S7K5_9ACTN|nr:hypothetical protein Airi02_064580 [Actinoallomurus iriomotensis]